MIATRKGVPVTEGLKKSGANVRADVQKPDLRHTALGKRAYDRRVPHLSRAPRQRGCLTRPGPLPDRVSGCPLSPFMLAVWVAR